MLDGVSTPGDRWVVSPRLRDARPEDALRVLAINASAGPGVTPLDRGELEELAGAAVLFRLAVVGDEPIAYLVGLGSWIDFGETEFWWFRSRYPDGRFLYIDQIAVAEGWRGRGIGTAMYEDVHAWARTEAVDRVVCEVNLRPPNPGSLRFHERHGYLEVGILTTPDGRTVSLRAKALQPLTESP